MLYGMRTSSAIEQIRTHGLSPREGTRNHLNQSGFKISPAVLYAGIGTPRRLTRHDTHQMGPGLIALRTNKFPE